MGRLPGRFPSRANTGQCCNLRLGLVLSLLAPSFFLCIACANPSRSAETSPQAHVASTMPEQSGPPSPSSRGPQSAPAGLMRHIGIAVPPSDVPSGLELEAWLESIARAGFTMILLDAGTREGVRDVGEPRPMGSLGRVYFRTGLAETDRDVFGDLVPIAHRYGLSVFAGVSLRRMNWVDPTLGWMDRSYDPGRQQLRITPYLDLFHPAFQEYLTGLFMDLADTGVDGVLFLNDAPVGPTDGFSFFALRGFERDFQIKADPAKLSSVPISGMPASEDAAQVNSPQPSKPPEFWQWSGWKARETIKIMAKLGRAMRTHVPGMLYALEVHPEAVTDPLKALVQYGEDLLEVKRNGFQFFLVRTPPQQTAGSTPFLDRMEQLIGEKERIWIPVLSPSEDIRRADKWLPTAAQGEDPSGGVGLIYMRELN